MTKRLRVAICADFVEEGWPSMDRVAGHLLGALDGRHRSAIDAVPVCPPFRRRATRVAFGRVATNLDRGLNRLFDYPRHVARIAAGFDAYHVVDHSYAQLAHRLPPGRTVVTCHDLDAFRCLFDRDGEPRSAAFRLMSRHVLEGLRRAACVTCDTAAVRDELVARGLVPLEQTRVVPIGAGDEFCACADPEADNDAARLVGAPPGAIEVLHVGSSIPRKRIELVLRCAAELRRERPEVHLVRVGGPLTAGQEALARAMGLDRHMSALGPVTDRTLAAVYRRAAVLVLPSDREGFGLPVVEALACGTPVIARDLPVLREVGGGAATYVDGDDPGAWARALLGALREREAFPSLCETRRRKGIARARHFTWSRFADDMRDVYEGLAHDGKAEVIGAPADCCA